MVLSAWLNDIKPFTRKGVAQMTNIEMLKHIIDESGMTMVAISEKSGIKRETLYNRLAGTGEFTASEIVGLTRALGIQKSTRDQIFLAE